MSFDMPKIGTWEERGGWVVRALGRDISLSLDQAAGLVGNLGYESIEFVVYHEGGMPADKGGVGWAQWTASRRRNFEAWCAAAGINPQSDEASYGFLIEELTGVYKSFAGRLRQCVTLSDACLLTHKEYETPSDVLDGSYRSQPDRLHFAQRALAGALAVAEPPLPSPVPQLVTAATDALTRLLAAPKPTLTMEVIMTLRLIQDIIDAICGPRDAAKSGDQQPAPVDVSALLDRLAAAHPSLNVRISIVDLMVALGFPAPTLDDRRELAKELGVAGDVGSAETNAAMHKELLRRVAANGGRVPDDLL